MQRHLVCLATAGLLLASMAMAAPSTMTIQGHLANGGTPTDGDHPTIFSLYDASTGGTLRWSETDTIHVASYLYSSVLGNNTPLPAGIFNQQLWLETAVDGTILSPRIQLTTAPYSQWAQRSDTATVALNGTPNGGQWDTDGTNAWRTGGKVGIGTANPTATLQVAGSTALRGATSNQDSRPLVGSGLISGEVRAYSSSPNALQMDDGFLRLSAGGGTNSAAQSYLDLTGFSTTPDMYQNIVLGTSGTERMRILNDGKVGIGTASPQGRVDIASGAGTELVFSGSGNANILAPNEDLRIDAGLGWSLLFGADGIAEQLIVRHNQTIVNGDLSVNGSLSVTGTKCRVVKTENRGELRVNAAESGHALFIDDGQTATLTNGRCRVDLDPRFLATVTVDDAHRLIVNVTFYGPHGDGWYVQRDQRGFTVIDPSGSSAEFSWTVTARQKGYEGVYLDPVDAQTAKR